MINSKASAGTTLVEKDASKKQDDILEHIFGKRQQPQHRFEPKGFQRTHPLRDLILQCMPDATEEEIQEEIRFVEVCKLGNWEFDHLWSELNTHRLKAKAEILKACKQKKFRRGTILRFMVQILDMIFTLAFLMRKLYERRYLQPQVEPVWNTSTSLTQSKVSDAWHTRWRNHPKVTPPPY